MATNKSMKRNRFVHPEDRYKANHVQSPLPKAILMAAVAMIIVALAAMVAARYGLVREGTTRMLSKTIMAAHLLRGTGECILLGCAMWGMAAWDIYPKAAFGGAIGMTALYHLVAAYSYYTGAAAFWGHALHVTHAAFIIYTIAGLLLCISMLITFTGDLFKTFCLYAASLICGAAAIYITQPETATAAYVVNKIAAVAFTLSLYRRLSV